MTWSFAVPIEAFALAGIGAEFAADDRRVELPPPGTKRKGGRLPLLASALAQRATESTHSSAAVLFGTALGCLTETELFVTHMIAADEATPRPRAFSASVHNAIASKVAMDLGAFGSCQTFVQAEASFAHALLQGCLIAHDSRAPIYVGAVDEASEFVDRGLRHCGHDVQIGEGGAVLRLGHPESDHRGPRITRVELTRIDTAGDDDPGTLVAVPSLDGSFPERPGSLRAPFAELHSSLLATATALATGILSGEILPEALGLGARPGRITLVLRSRFGDSVCIRLEG